MVVFDEKVMKKFMQSDSLINFMVKDLVQRGHEKDKALLIVFNSEILGDSEMEEAYLREGSV